MDQSIVLPSKPRIVREKDNLGVYEIDGLYPGYGHTLGNSLRRIILSSLPGAAITSVKIEGVSHEFSTIDGVKEDVVMIILQLKKVRMKITGEGTQSLELKIKGPKEVSAADIKAPGQVEILNPEQHLMSLTGKTEVRLEITVEQGLGYVPKEALQKERVEIGAIAVDAAFTPIRRVNYEVENMRVGNRTDFNRLRVTIETDGSLKPAEALSRSIGIMINQLKAVVGFKEEELIESENIKVAENKPTEENKSKIVLDPELLKTRIESLSLSQRTINSLTNGNIRTLGGLARKKEEDLLDIDGLGSKGVQEIRKLLSSYGIIFK
ncbi:MAG TPA: DNA-directed RNA polymerase subunit alpha [Candidatus Paceibacterota bacterium]